MFDFHTHILPGIDDGSSSAEESLRMLNELKLQGVEGIAATPHFYAEQSSPTDFFARRRRAWEQLKPHLTPDLPEIRLGAEVRYFEGINQCDGLEQFCIEGTDLLLLEMPHGVWTRRMIAALAELSGRGNITLLLAHVERYLRRQKKETWNDLLRCGIRMQVSADFFVKRGSRRTAMKLLRDGRIHLLGTDCHNMTSRKPNMGDAVSVIQHKSGDELLQRITNREHMLLQTAAQTDDLICSAGIGGGLT